MRGACSAIRRAGIVATVGAMLALSGAALAQPAKRMDALWTTTQAAAAPLIKALEDGLAEHGWIAGSNLVLQHHFTDGRLEELAPLAGRIVAARPDVIWAGLSSGAFALRQRTTTIPIVVGSAINPVGSGLIASLARPGGNITGLGADTLEFFGKRIQLLREVVPGLATVGILYSADYPDNREAVAAMTAASTSLGIRVLDGAIRKPGDVAPRIDELVKDGIEALVVVSDNLTFLRRDEIADLALRSRLPSVSQMREFCDVGVLICYSANTKAMFKRSAYLVDRILRGANPADLPFEQPSLYEFVVNLRTAGALRLPIEGLFLARADEVIE